MPSEGTVAHIGEFGIIARGTVGRAQSRHTIVGPGDDAALVEALDGRVVATTDVLVQDRHFRLDWSSPFDIGRKAIAQNGADIAAMGARCTAFLVGLGCPADTPVEVTDGIFAGLWDEAGRAGASVVGGDLVRTDMLIVSVTALGTLEGRRPVLRSGAVNGDVVAVAGRLGWSAGGMALLQSGTSGHRALVDAHRVPMPEYEQGARAAEAGATSLTDVSDGLLADLGHIAEASSVSIDIDSESLVISGELRSAASELGTPALSWVLSGGEDHALVGTFPSSGRLPDGWVPIGRVVGSDSTPAVTVDGSAFTGSRGWSSFQD